MKVKGKCSYCGAEGNDTFQVETPEPKAKGENFLTTALVVFGISGILVLLSAFFYFHPTATEQEVEERIAEQYKDDCWVSDVQKEMGLPRATDEELWCEAHGHCGPARQTLVAEMVSYAEELDKILPEYNDTLEQLIKCKKENKEHIEDWNELYDEMTAYSEASIESLCAEEVQRAWEDASEAVGMYHRCVWDSHKEMVKVYYAEEKLGQFIDEKKALAWWNEDE